MEMNTQEIEVEEIELGGPVKNHNYHSDESIQELADNIEEIGLINPIIVWWDNDSDCYRVAAGERRYRAVRRLGWEKTEAKVIDPSGDKDILQYQVSENRIREYSWLIEARQIYELMSGEDGKSTDFVADLFDIAHTTIMRRRQIGFLLSLSSLEISDTIVASEGGSSTPAINIKAMKQLASGLLRPSKGGSRGVTYNPFDQETIDDYLYTAIEDNWSTDQARAEMTELRLEDHKDKVEKEVRSEVQEKLDKKKDDLERNLEKKYKKQLEEKENQVDQLEDEIAELEDTMLEAEADSDELKSLKARLSQVEKKKNEFKQEKAQLKQKINAGPSEEERERVRKEIKADLHKRMEKERKELEKKEEKVGQKEEQLEKREADLKERVLKPRQHHRRIVQNISDLRGNLANVDNAWLRLLTEKERQELVSQFEQLARDVSGVISQIKEVENGNESPELIENG